MAKRFIDTEIFNDPWFMDVTINWKLFLIYLITNCDHSGIIDLNKKLCCFQTGIKNIEKNLEEIGDRVISLLDNYYFIPKFIEFKYPDFPQSTVRQQQGAIKILESFGLFKDGILTVNKDLKTLNKESRRLTKTYDNDNGNVDIKEGDKIEKLREWYRKQIELSGKDRDYTLFAKFLFDDNDFSRPLIEVLKLTEQIGWEHYQVLQKKVKLMREKKGYSGTLKQKVLGYVNGGYKKTKFFGTMDSWITGDANNKNIDLPDNDEIRKHLRK